LESNWRRNVAEIGMADSGWALTSPVRLEGYVDLWLVKLEGHPHQPYLYYLPPGELPVYSHSGLLQEGYFPWDYDVDPD